MHQLQPECTGALYLVPPPVFGIDWVPRITLDRAVLDDPLDEDETDEVRFRRNDGRSHVSSHWRKVIYFFC